MCVCISREITTKKNTIERLSRSQRKLSLLFLESSLFGNMISFAAKSTSRRIWWLWNDQSNTPEMPTECFSHKTIENFSISLAYNFEITDSNALTLAGETNNPTPHVTLIMLLICIIVILITSYENCNR